MFQANGQPSLFFDNCAFPAKPTIEVLGSAFGEFLRSLRYQDGQAVPQVDVVAHSMGGLIVRSYLAGKLPDGTFAPPADPRIRRLAFLGTPHFGSFLAEQSASRDAQILELEPGSRFLFDLATWNQGADDLRGVDAISVVGNAGNAGNIFVPARARFHDSTVTLTSGSLDFVSPGRTRVLNFCHTNGIAELLCSGQEGFLAQITSATHGTARIVASFFNGTDEWRTIGESPETNSLLSGNGGLLLQWKNAADQPINIQSAAVAGRGNLAVRANQIAHSDFLPKETLAITLAGTPPATASISLPPFSGGTQAATVKPGPFVAGVFPTFSRVMPRSLAPGMFISVYGTALSAETLAAPGQPYPASLGGVEVRLGTSPLPLHYVSGIQINAVLPENITGAQRLTVRSSVGEHTVNVVIEAAVPSLFGRALNAVTNAEVSASEPLRPGDYVAVYLTGLGNTEQRGGLDWARLTPEVTIGGRPCELQYAGRAPGYVGLDQINCRIPLDIAPGDSVGLSVRAGTRVSNVINLPIR